MIVLVGGDRNANKLLLYSVIYTNTVVLAILVYKEKIIHSAEVSQRRLQRDEDTWERFWDMRGSLPQTENVGIREDETALCKIKKWEWYAMLHLETVIW